jgi:heptosyltransferase III
VGASNILLIQLRQLGDIILTTPCIRELKRAWPDARITFLCHPMGRLILEDNPAIDQLLTYDPKLPWYREWDFVRKLRSQHYDLVLDFMYNPRSALYARLSGAPKRLAFPSRRQWLFTDIVPQDPVVEYIVLEKFRYLRNLGIKPERGGLVLPWFPQHAKVVEEWIAAETSLRSSAPRVILAPTHRRVDRQWPLERYAAIADRLTRDWGAMVIWAWGPGEQDFVQGAQKHCKTRTLLAPKTSFRELAALIANCDLFIGNSNGPSHVAVAVDTPSLQLHGPTYAATWCPRTERHQALQAGHDRVEGRGPMDLIREEELWQALKAMEPIVSEAKAARQLAGIRRTWQPDSQGMRVP